MKRVAMLVLAGCLVGSASGQALRGDIRMNLQGTYSRSQGQSSTRLEWGADRQFTDRWFAGASGLVQKQTGRDRLTGIAGRLGMLLNADPGKQKVVPYLGVGGGYAWGELMSVAEVGGRLGALVYANRHAGFSVELIYSRCAPRSDREGYSNYSELTATGGFFINFPVRGEE